MKFIKVKFTLEGLHQYKDAPDEVGYLKNQHRHLFYISAKIEVFHNDRELEFIMVKNRINKFIAANIASMPVVYSCEMMCEDIIKFLEKTYCTEQTRLINVSVSEDDENGAIVYNDAYTF